jgi:hypothetical protein
LSEAEQAIEEINDVLSKLDNVTANPYRNFLKSIADSVAEAALKPAAPKAKKPAAKAESTRSPAKKTTARPAARPAAPKAKAARPASSGCPAVSRMLKQQPQRRQPAIKLVLLPLGYQRRLNILRSTPLSVVKYLATFL